MEWNKVDELQIQESIQSINSSLEQVGKEDDTQWLKENDNPFSITLANDETLSMIPILIPFQSVLSEFKIPSAQDVIIPDPCFDINDMLEFQCVRTTEKTNSSQDLEINETTIQNITKEQIESIRNELIENSQSSQISPSLSSLLSHFQLNQWNELLSSFPATSLTPSFLTSFLSSIHTPELGLSLLQSFFSYWLDHHQEDQIRFVVKKCSIYSLSNSQLMEWVENLQSTWNNQENVYACMNFIHSSFYFVYLIKHE